MDIRRLETFCKVYELKSFSKAGEDLFLSQPTISAHVASLESELEIALFDRIGHSVLPTQAAKVLYKHAQDVIDLLKKAVAEIYSLQDRIAGKLHIGGSTIPGHYLFPQLLKLYMSKYPEVEIHLEIDDSSKVAERVISGQIEFGIIGAKEEYPDLIFNEVMRDELIVVGKRGYFPKTVDESENQKLEQLPWVIREKGSGTRKAMESGLNNLGLNIKDLNIVATVHSTESLLRCVQAGLGITITSRLVATAPINRNELAIINVMGLSLERSFYLVYHKQRKLFPLVNSFLSFLQNINLDINKYLEWQS